jgi:ankyrin repeat protein
MSSDYNFDLNFAGYKSQIENGERSPTSISPDGCSILAETCISGSMEDVKYLVEKGANVNFSGLEDKASLLKYVLEFEHTNEKVLNYLIENGARFCSSDFNNVKFRIFK